jgi:hypothetical protein
MTFEIQSFLSWQLSQILLNALLDEEQDKRRPLAYAYYCQAVQQIKVTQDAEQLCCVCSYPDVNVSVGTAIKLYGQSSMACT